MLNHTHTYTLNSRLKFANNLTPSQVLVIITDIKLCGMTAVGSQIVVELFTVETAITFQLVSVVQVTWIVLIGIGTYTAQSLS